MIGILASDNIADLKPLGDRLLVEVSSVLCSSRGCPSQGSAYLTYALPFLPGLANAAEIIRDTLLCQLLTRLRRARMRPRGACS